QRRGRRDHPLRPAELFFAARMKQTPECADALLALRGERKLEPVLATREAQWRHREVAFDGRGGLARIRPDPQHRIAVPLAAHADGDRGTLARLHFAEVDELLGYVTLGAERAQVDRVLRDAELRRIDQRACRSIR